MYLSFQFIFTFYNNYQRLAPSTTKKVEVHTHTHNYFLGGPQPWNHHNQSSKWKSLTLAIVLKDGVMAISNPGPQENLIKQPVSSAQPSYLPQPGVTTHEMKQPMEPGPGWHSTMEPTDTQQLTLLYPETLTCPRVGISYEDYNLSLGKKYIESQLWMFPGDNIDLLKNHWSEKCPTTTLRKEGANLLNRQPKIILQLSTHYLPHKGSLPS